MCNCIQLHVCVRAFLHFCNCSWRCCERDSRGGIILDIVVLGRPIATCKVVCCSKFAPFCGNITAAWSVCQCMRWHVHIVSLQAVAGYGSICTYVFIFEYICAVFTHISGHFCCILRHNWLAILQIASSSVKLSTAQTHTYTHKMRLQLLQGVPSVDVSHSSSNKRWWPWTCVY